MKPGLALDPNSYAAKARKRKEPPTEADVLSSARKRALLLPPQEGASVDSPTSAVTTQGQAAETSSSEAARPTPERVTGAVSAISSQETTPGQSQPMEVSQTALPGQGIQQTAVVDGTPSTTTVTRAVTTAQSQGDVSG